MKVYDISMEISPDMPVYKNKSEKRPLIKVMQDYSRGNSYESRIQMDMHTGTHIDAPLHMIKDGTTVDKIDLNKLVTVCRVLDLSSVSERITKEDLKEKDINSGEFILLKTANSNDIEFNFNFVYLEKTGAEYLKEKNIIGVGIDALGIERSQVEHETHRILLSSNIIIIEGLKLKNIEEGEYNMVAAPLKIMGVEASPARVLLLKEDS